MQLIMVRPNFALAVVVATAVLNAASISIGQSQPPAPTSPQPTITRTTTFTPNAGFIPPNNQSSLQGFEYRVDPQGRVGYWQVNGEAMEEQNEMAALQEKLKSKSTDAASKEVVRKKMTDILAKQFDRDLDSRVKQIAALESQLATLKEQVEKRRTVKDRLVELRLELVLNEAEGLGFPNSWNSPSAYTQVWTGGTNPVAPVPAPLNPAQ